MGSHSSLGHGDQDRTEVAERRLTETHEQLAGAERLDLEQVRAVVRSSGLGGWQTCWRSTRTPRPPCGPWCRRFRRSPAYRDGVRSRSWSGGRAGREHRRHPAGEIWSRGDPRDPWRG